MNAAVVTVSDRSATGEREDRSGPAVAKVLADAGWEVASRTVVADAKLAIVEALLSLCDDSQVNLLLTTGGTGAGPRDVTPEATQMVVERPFPGIAEALRRESEKHSKYATLSRGTAGSRGHTLIINLPGNPKAIGELWPVLEPIVGHACRLLAGQDDPHA
jgi:molybdenum cofactor synthesis domain-containing protein